jgi:hypothetical protein
MQYKGPSSHAPCWNSRSAFLLVAEGNRTASQRGGMSHCEGPPDEHREDARVSSRLARFALLGLVSNIARPRIISADAQ